MLKIRFKKGVLEAGCDEAGRGCLAGPVFAAAVILPENYRNKHLNDSKVLTAANREELREEIQQKALAWAVASLDNHEIDKINILNASIQSMHLALDQLTLRPEYILVDGNRFKRYGEVPHSCIIKGDGQYMSIAAASVLAKTYRDDWMRKIDDEFPHYGWKQNKGYPTAQHRKAIAAHGATHYHRMSFQLLDPQMTIDFRD